MDKDRSQNGKYSRAKKRIKELKGFYWHFAIYVMINSFFTVNKVLRNYYNGETWNEAILDFNTFSVWIFWGIGLAFHALNVFGIPFIFGKNWEDRKLKEFMDKDNNQYKSFK